MNCPYFYIIEHKSGKLYAGVKVANADPLQLLNESHDFPYFTSSKIVNGLLKEDRNSFSITDIILCDSKEHAYEIEHNFLSVALRIEPDLWLNRWKGGKQWSMAGIRHTDEAKVKMSIAKLGKKRSDDVKANLSVVNGGINNPFCGKTHSAESILKMKVPKRKIMCPHCLVEGGANVMPRHHFDNCHTLIGKKKSVVQYKRTKFICPHCLKEGSGPNMKRYHFNNCKEFKE